MPSICLPFPFLLLLLLVLFQVSAPQTDVGRRGHTTAVFSLGHKHFQLVIYGGVSEWLSDKPHREQPMIAETAVLELSKSLSLSLSLSRVHTHASLLSFFPFSWYMCVCRGSDNLISTMCVCVMPSTCSQSQSSPDLNSHH